MCSLLQCGIEYRHDSKDDNHFICNLYKEYIKWRVDLRVLIHQLLHATVISLMPRPHPLTQGKGSGDY